MAESFEKCALKTIERQSWVQQGDGYDHSRIPQQQTTLGGLWLEKGGTTRIGLISCPVNAPMDQKRVSEGKKGLEIRLLLAPRLGESDGFCKTRSS